MSVGKTTPGLTLACLMSPNVLRPRPVQGSRSPGRRGRTGPCCLPQAGVRASEPGPGRRHQPLPQRHVLPSLPAPAPGLGPGLRPCGSHLYQQVLSRAVPERQGTEGASLAGSHGRLEMNDADIYFFQLWGRGGLERGGAGQIPNPFVPSQAPLAFMQLPTLFRIRGL